MKITIEGTEYKIQPDGHDIFLESKDPNNYLFLKDGWFNLKIKFDADKDLMWDNVTHYICNNLEKLIKC